MSGVRPGAEGRFVYLDGIRGLASLMVAVAHFVAAFQYAMLNAMPAQSHFAGDTEIAHTGLVFFYNPDFGVAVFFALSGFVLAASVADRRPPYPVLLMRRWIRLCLPVLMIAVPIWVIATLGGFAAAATQCGDTHSTWLPAAYVPADTHLPLWSIVQSALFSFVSGHRGVVTFQNTVLWTMPIEMLGSFGLYAGYCFGNDVFRRPRGCFCVAALTVIATFHTEFYGIGLGVALFEIRRGISLMSPVWRAFLGRLMVPVGVVVLLAGLWAGSAPFVNDRGSYFAFIQFMFWRLGVMTNVADMHHAGAALVIAAALMLKPMQRVLMTPVVRYLGRVSFMLYLVQVPVLCTVGVFVFLHSGATGYEARALRVLVAYLVVAFALAEIATRLIDQPAIRLSRLAARKGERLFELRSRLPWAVRRFIEVPAVGAD